MEEARKHEELIRGGGKPTPAQTRLGRQMEKDERFWVAAALMSLYHSDGGAGRAELFARLLERAGLRPPPGFPRWQDALAGALDLFFEVNLPSPGRYRAWLRDHLGERTLVPYLKEQAQAPGSRLEGATKADAMLLARENGVAVIFEAKVLSDISVHVTFDLARNQLARNIDVMLDANPALAAPLSLRQPERTFLVLLTSALTQPGQPGTRSAKAGSTAGSCPPTRTRPAPCSASICPTATARAGRSRHHPTGLGQLGRLQRHSPRRLPVAYSHPGRRVRRGQIRSRPLACSRQLPASWNRSCGRS